MLKKKLNKYSPEHIFWEYVAIKFGTCMFAELKNCRFELIEVDFRPLIILVIPACMLILSSNINNVSLTMITQLSIPVHILNV